ncbi:MULTISPECIES: SixA phosphatase family protein [Nocardiopsidaceae]|uniref:Histidine phosphatase family protein n=2 Tax=Nocardiopsidaceae TaxID=83676 RepID=A0ABY6YMX4_9ACTN|nr:histidine phosphatase family protein [Streptomonospora nanhaiensis]WAE73697.1 histidine phosphatase family protein [Streptomonospora nanhaiensis]
MSGARTLLLMRHAEAENGHGADYERGLTDLGRAQADAVGRMLSRRGYAPDHVICSGARRTRQTLDGVLGAMEPGPRPEVDYSEEAYSAGVDTLLELVNRVDAGVRTLLVVAHNPTVAQVAAGFVGNEALVSYAPGTIAAVDLEVEWLYAAPGTGAGILLN